MSEFFVIFVLLLINAFFALSEMAIVSASKPMLRQMAKQGNARAEVALRLAEDPGKFLSTVQVGITLVGTLAGAYGGATIAAKFAPLLDEVAWINPYGNTVALVLVVTLITFLSVVIGELIPKQLALKNSEALAMFVARPMHFLSRITAPVVYLFETAASLAMRLLGIRPDDPDHVTEEEVHAIMAEGVESGAIEKSEHEMLRRIIRLGDRNVKSIMTHRTEVSFIDVNDSLETVGRKIDQFGHSRYPVVDGPSGDVLGAVLAKEILNAPTSGPFDVRRYIKEIHTLPETASCLKALEAFKSSSINMAMIVDEYGSTEGIITIADILEAIVGVLPSNYDDIEHALIRQREDGSYLVDGRTPIDEIHLTIGIEGIDADGNFETIAGFLVQQLRKTPEEGDVAIAHGYRFEVVDMDARRIDKILVSRSDETVN
ncbi:HlyC/CorC family transporter [Ensifer sp. ENS07]|jgi:putative hemolysin|uniref:Hemolysin family protein n=1 Tax=Ensifer adhaerens TaxID=106592 RepID=A0A9Q8Y8V1_ENSAD|nr:MULTISPECIES: hemolysin family protein [Ensifer]MBD9496053.1 HlyC/CorC family transporter [Ensifer sp. ENS01]MBD9522358.1 HlyC/CorC family transporter [Ensifer sp. ENS02]MBD9596066.1 HlyC/CorC family transporter [Ensifer sp. ENS05]MBD9635879.1 HlyC/CorC family transporter [Ensifer sp. ENS07]USJ24643.1 hemolysin family protein [Ensifer adhaerens]